MGVLKNSMAFAALLCFVGCSSGQAPPAASPPAKTVLDPLLQDEQRARDVQKAVDESAEKQRKSLDDQERGDSPP